MNLYFIVEGVTERRVYPEWFETLLPNYQRIYDPFTATQQTYYLEHGGGLPHTYEQISEVMLDLNANQLYQFLIVCLDSEELTIDERIAEIQEELTTQPQGYEVKYIIQNPCFETWLLGNDRMCSKAPHKNPVFIDYYKSYPVNVKDPELLPSLVNGLNRAKFHHAYLLEMLKEKGEHIHYSKPQPSIAKSPDYLAALVNRAQTTGHIASFHHLIQFCDRIR